MMSMLNTEWFWAIFGLSLFFFEFMAPGIFCIWIGSAALLTALIVSLFDLSFLWSLLCFSLLALSSIAIAYRLNRPSSKIDLEKEFLNARDRELIGRIFPLKDPIHDGLGTIQVNDTLWRVQGKDSPKGTKVRVLSRKGNTLLVESDEAPH
jgi:membrane protein implicated in regulation of membrane protease activity